jgi:hypothetical protein
MTVHAERLFVERHLGGMLLHIRRGYPDRRQGMLP